MIDLKGAHQFRSVRPRLRRIGRHIALPAARPIVEHPAEILWLAQPFVGMLQHVKAAHRLAQKVYIRADGDPHTIFEKTFDDPPSPALLIAWREGRFSALDGGAILRALVYVIGPKFIAQALL